MISPFLKRSETYVQGSMMLPRKYFTQEEIFTQELERIFYRHWICVGRASQIRNPGDYFLQTVGRESLIILRDKSGKLRAHYNVCRHRGTRLCEQPHGRLSETIQCPYHAWTYALDGRLIGAPLMQDVIGFEKHDYSLHRASLSEWEGFIFANLSIESEPFEAAFSPIMQRFTRFNLPVLEVARHIEYEVQANWKLLFQNYSECLHCPTLHPSLARLSPYQSGENDLYEGPYLGGYMEIVDEAASLTMSGRVCGLPVGDLPPEDSKRVYYYSIFPNLLVSIHPDYVMFHLLWPRSPRLTQVTCAWMFHPDSFQQPDFDPDEAVNFWDMTNRQDWHICELSQAGIESRAYTPGPYSARETLAAAWDREYLRALEDTPRPE